MLIMLMFAVSALADGKGMHYELITYHATVHADNSWDVTETIKVVFDEPHHGIYKYLHTTFNIRTPKSFLGYNYLHDITYTSDVDFDDDAFKIDGLQTDLYDIVEEDELVGVKMGSASETVTGVHTYQMTYKYTYPVDQTQDADLLMHTILPEKMEVETKKLVFTIKFDKALPESTQENILYFRGPLGSTAKGDTDEMFIEDDHTLTGTFYNIQPYNAVTIRAELPEGYYTNGPDQPWHHTAFYFFVIAAIIALIFIPKALFTRKKIVTKQIEFYPPEGMCSAEVGVIIDNSADNDDLASLIPWFASQGYLTIEERVGEDKKKSLWIKRIKNLPDDAPEYQQLFMKGLFDMQKAEEVELSKLKYTHKMEEATDALSNVFDNEKTLATDGDVIGYIFVIVIFGFLSLWTNTNMPFLSMDFLLHGLWMLILYAVPTIAIAAKACMMYSNPLSGFFSKLMLAIVTPITMLITVCLIMFFEMDVHDMVILFITLLLTYLSLEVMGMMIDSTDYRLTYLGKLMGLKEFIETAEKQRLNELVHDDPYYFYKVLPYAMALGVSSEWGDKFRDIPMNQPDWYHSDSSTHFSTHHFTNSLYSASDSGMRTASTAPESSWSGSSSSSSWGGSSGGGGGGGGGGGW